VFGMTPGSLSYQTPSPRKRAVGIALTVLVHALVVLVLLWQRKTPLPQDIAGSRVTVLLPPLAAPSPRAPPPPPAAAPSPKPQPTPRRTPPPPPPPINPESLRSPMPVPTKPPEPTPPQPTPAPTPPATQTLPMDLSEFIKQRRQAQTAPPAPSDAENPSENDVAMANINRNLQSLMPGRRPGVGGVFEILHKGTREARFAFNGWNPGIGNQWREVIDVDAGIGGNVELTIVRRMIAMIRTHYQGNFNWQSHRLNRVVVLSARLEDNAALEAFLMQEFFEVRR
jgi:hypothetical protein